MSDLNIPRKQLAKLLILNSQTICAIKAGVKFKAPASCLRVAVDRLKEMHDILLSIGGVINEKRS